MKMARQKSLRYSILSRIPQARMIGRQRLLSVAVKQARRGQRLYQSKSSTSTGAGRTFSFLPSSNFCKASPTGT